MRQTAGIAATPAGVREVTEVRLVSPVPERYRVAVVGSGRQIDICLPAEARVADVVPHLSGLIAQRDNAARDPAVRKGETTHRHLLVRGRPDGARLAADQTLRAAGVQSGDTLYLRTERTLRPPTLYDDVVDAAAQLNRAAYAAWGQASAAVAAGVALYTGVAVLIWMSLDARFAVERNVIVALQGVVAAALYSAAAAAHRLHGADRVAAMFGWAAVPLTAAAIWTPLSGAGWWGSTAACAAVIVANYLAFRLIGAAGAGFIAGAVVAAVAGVTLGVQGWIGLDHKAVYAVAGTGLVLAGHLIPRYRGGRSARRRRPVRLPRREALKRALDEDQAQPQPDPWDTLPTAESVSARGRAAANARCALYTGAGAGLVLSILMLLRPWAQPRWADLAFAAACALALGLQARACRTAAERAVPILAGSAVVLSAAAAALAGPPPFGAVGAACLALGMLGSVAVGFAEPADSVVRRLDGFAAYAGYLATAALIPLALNVAGWYSELAGGRP